MAEPMTPEVRDTLAAELALGVLEGEALVEAMRLQLADPDFAAQVAAWRARLAPLGEAFPEAPAPQVWPAIERRLGKADDARTVVALRRWRIAAIGSGALAASLALVLILRPAPTPVEVVRTPDRVIVAQLDGGADGGLLAARYDPETGSMRVRATRLPESRLAPELWVIPSDGVPRSLGLVAPSGMTRVTLTPQQRALIADGATLAITMEPREGAPHKGPSSPPVAAGKIQSI